MFIDYFVTSELWLSLEDYTNAGLTSGQIREIIENITEPFQKNGYDSGHKLTCRPMMINGNWIVSTISTDTREFEIIVGLIEARLVRALEVKKIY